MKSITVIAKNTTAKDRNDMRQLAKECQFKHHLMLVRMDDMLVLVAKRDVINANL